MNEIATRYATVAGGFTDRVNAVPADAWDNPTPCEGWVARDIIRHVTEWIPAFFNNSAGLNLPTGISVADDPVGAWASLHASLCSALADPAVAQREFDGPPGRMSVEQSIDMIVTGDLLIHTWDLARATGLDETLDATEARRMLEGIEPFDEMLRSSGHYGPRVIVSDDADVTSKLVAFVGRNPATPQPTSAG
jgi:uncharacterized protein (TIGR03086 family)